MFGQSWDPWQLQHKREREGVADTLVISLNKAKGSHLFSCEKLSGGWRCFELILSQTQLRLVDQLHSASRSVLYSSNWSNMSPVVVWGWQSCPSVVVQRGGLVWFPTSLFIDIEQLTILNSLFINFSDLFVRKILYLLILPAKRLDSREYKISKYGLLRR